jgi:hypothetical protein
MPQISEEVLDDKEKKPGQLGVYFICILFLSRMILLAEKIPNYRCLTLWHQALCRSELGSESSKRDPETSSV